MNDEAMASLAAMASIMEKMQGQVSTLIGIVHDQENAIAALQRRADLADRPSHRRSPILTPPRMLS